jgi:predicted short-subunit dehydrogenase-like oxidoreductase (DUF2520 family)
MGNGAQSHIAVVGAGRVGQVLGRLLRDGGAHVTAVVSRTPASARKGGAFLRCRNAGTSLEAIPATTRLVLITTPHSAVEETAGAIARLTHLPFTRMAFCHASGMLTAGALAPLAARGATVFSFHPIQTFPRDFTPSAILPSLAGIWYGVDGDSRGVRAARRLARSLGGRAVVIPPGLRVYYHAACVVASNHLTALLAVLEEMHGRLGLDGPGFFALFKPIIEATLRNNEATSPREALSGPVARGGVETVARHLEAVRLGSPRLAPFFDAMTLETVVLALRKGSIDERRAEEFRELLARMHGTTRESSS